MKQKTEKLCKEILEKGLTLLDNTSSSNYISSNRPLESQDQESKKSAWEFISDFLQEDLSQKLAKILEIDLETPIANKVVKSETSNSSSTKGTISGFYVKSMKKYTFIFSKGPKEDYSKDVKIQKNSSTEMTTKQKALAKSAKGSKSIASFFGKNPKK